MKTTLLLLVWMATSIRLLAHDWHRHEDPWIHHTHSPSPVSHAHQVVETVRPVVSVTPPVVQSIPLVLPGLFSIGHPAVSATTTASGPQGILGLSFGKFAPKVRFRSEGDWFLVESDGLPSHGMMIGITAWQQQVPLPQPYTGANAWRIPLTPVPAQNPVSIRGRFLRGAIALAANGIPIFNPQNNRGEISADIGELDQWGGHCGRADDYHYHAAPIHLQQLLGKSLPIAFALDGYPIYGPLEPDDSKPLGLDVFNGHETPSLGYHYHASLKYPFVQGGFHGRVTELEEQVDPQPRANPIRPFLQPLRGAAITGFSRGSNDQSFALDYQVNGRPAGIQYSNSGNGTWVFRFHDADGTTRTESYRADSRRGQGTGGERRNPDRKREDKPQRRSEAAPENEAVTSAQAPEPQPKGESPGFRLTSPVVRDGEALPAEFTGDGAGISPPLEWSEPPTGTRSLALLMHHVDPEGRTKCYWTLYNIPPETRSLAKGAAVVGVQGVNTINSRTAYAPPNSKGPGSKSYVLTLYALNSPLQLQTGASADPVGRDLLLRAMQDKVLATAQLRVTHARSSGDSGRPGRESADAGPRSRERDRQAADTQAGNRKSSAGGPAGLIKPTLNDTIRLQVYADNWFVLYVNGKLRAVDPIEFTPHNVVTIDLLPEYPMTLAILAKDNAAPDTGLEYGNQIGDGGLVLKGSDGTLSNAGWKARNFFKGPLDRDTSNPRVQHTPIPTNWFAVDFDDSSWSRATEYEESRVNPKQAYHEADFSGARFIWTDDLDLDNTVIFRTRIEKPGWKPRWNTHPDLDITNAPLR